VRTACFPEQKEGRDFREYCGWFRDLRGHSALCYKRDMREVRDLVSDV
jgi:hypothetical protein